MTWSVCTLLLTAVALMASRASVPAGPDSELGRAATRTLRLTHFVCAKCSETGQLSSRGLFLSREAVHRHIAASRPCSAAKMGIREIQVDVRTSDVLAGAGGAAGSAPDVRRSDTSQKVPCDASVELSVYIPCYYHRYHHGIHAGSVVV